MNRFIRVASLLSFGLGSCVGVVQAGGATKATIATPVIDTTALRLPAVPMLSSVPLADVPIPSKVSVPPLPLAIPQCVSCVELQRSR